MYFYSLVTHHSSLKIILPVCEFLNSEHDVPSISFPLTKFIRDVKLMHGKTPVFNTVTTDFSFAMLNSISISFNAMSLRIYIDQVYDAVTSKDQCFHKVTEFQTIFTKKIKLSKLSICAAHLIKQVCNRTRSQYKEKNVAKCIIRMYADLVTCEEFDLFVEKSAFFLLILSTEYISSFNLKAIESCCKSNNVKIKEIEKTVEDILDGETIAENAEPHHTEVPAASENKFMMAIFERYHEKVAMNEEARTSFENPFLSTELFEYFSKKNMPYCSLWSSFFSSYTTNNVVECYNKIVKRDLMDSHLREKPGRFIKLLRENTLSNLKLLSYGMKTKASTKGEIEDFIEKFKKRAKPADHFQKKVPDELKQEAIVISTTMHAETESKKEEKEEHILLKDPNKVKNIEELFLTSTVSIVDYFKTIFCFF